jgi:hypothetical protein
MFTVYYAFLLLSIPIKRRINLMALMLKHKQEKNYVEIPNKTAKAPEFKTKEKSISLQALGLIVNLWSYDVDSWEVHKTELYKRFELNRKTSVTSAWAELVEAKYILEYKVRKGRENDYVYAYSIEPFTSAEIEEFNQRIIDTYGDFSALDFQELKTNSSISTPENPQLLKIKEKKDTITKEKLNKTKASTRPSLAEIESTDKILKGIFKEVPFEEIKTRVIDDIEDGILIVKNVSQYKGIMTSRINDHLKKVKKANFRPNRSTRTELLPDWFDKSEPEPQTEPKEDLEAKKREIAEMLKMIDD